MDEAITVRPMPMTADKITIIVHFEKCIGRSQGQCSRSHMGYAILIRPVSIISCSLQGYII